MTASAARGIQWWQVVVELKNCRLSVYQNGRTPQSMGLHTFRFELTDIRQNFSLIPLFVQGMMIQESMSTGQCESSQETFCKTILCVWAP